MITRGIISANKGITRQLMLKKEVVNYSDREYTPLRAPFNDHLIYAKKGYAIFHQDLADLEVDLADHVKENFFTGFLNDANAFQYAVPNDDFRNQLIADGIDTLQKMMDKTLDYTARDLSLGGALADCNLSWFVGLTRYLFLDRNAFTGVIPAELGNLSNLERLYLYGNQLEGSIPAELGNLSNLTWLYLQGNQLEGSIPAELGNLSNLTHLYLYSNQLEGSIPAELGNLSNLTHLYLYSNQLEGSIPAELGNLSNLQRLHLYTNQLEGTIPAELGNLHSIERYWLQVNNLTSYEQGAITPQMTSLNDIRLREQGTSEANTGLDSESVDRVVFDVADMLLDTEVTGGTLQLHGNHPHTSAIDEPMSKYGGLSAKDYIAETVANGGKEWTLTIETP